MTIATGESLKVVQEVQVTAAIVALNVWYYKADFVTPQTEQAVVDACEVAMEDIYTELVAEIKSTVDLADMAVYKRDGLVWTLIGTGAPTVAFTGVNELLPSGVAALMRAYTEHPRTIGRKYMAGFLEDAFAGQVWEAPTLAALAAAAVEWGVTRIISANNDLIPGVWSTVALNVRVMNGVFVIPTVPGYQRRRRQGVGI